MTKTFEEVISGIRKAKKGVEVREDLAQMGEYCKQFTDEAGQKADSARDEAKGYAAAAKASEKKATDAVAGIEQTKTDAVQAVQNAQTTATTAVQQAQSTATTAVTTKQTEAVQAVDDKRDAALQQVANSTRAAQTAASNASTAANAAGNAATAAGGYASNAKSSATAASGSASAAATSESNAASSAQSAGDDANRAEAAAKLAGTRANTDKTLKTENAPADAAATGAAIEKCKADTLLAAYPVGSLYMSAEATSPASLFGGTWEQIKDRFILAAGDTYAAGSTGGSKSHNHSIGAMFAAAYVNGNYVEYNYSGNTEWASNYKNTIPNGATAMFVSETHNSGITVYGSPTKEAGNMPPYVAMYVWKRIA